MAAVADVRVHDDWTGGHYGSIGPFKCAPNQYRAINLQLYSNGTLGPRPGWKELTTSGTGPNIVAGSGQEFYGVIWLPSTTDGGTLLFVSGNDASETVKLDIDTLTWSTTTLGIPSTVIVSDPNCHSFALENPNQLVVGATKVYNESTDTTTTITYPDSFAPTRAAFYGVRLYAWGDATYPNRVYYSDADTYTFTSGNYFNIGPGGSTAATRSTVMQAFPIKDMLLFYALPASKTDTQLHGEWWALTGATPITGSLRRIGKDIWPSVPNNAVVYKDAVLFQDYLYEQAGVAVHDGVSLNTQMLKHIAPRSGHNLATATAGLGGIASYGVPSVVLPYRIGSANLDPTGSPVGENYDGGLQAWELVGGTWTKALWWNGAQAEVVTNERRFLFGITPWEGNKMLCVTNTSADGSGTYRVFSRHISQSRPSRTGDTLSNPLETHTDLTGVSGIDAQLWLPAVEAAQHRSVRAEQVIVDFDYWKNSDFPEDVELKVQVAQFRVERGEFALSDEVVADLTALANSEGRMPARGRVSIPLPRMDWASAFQIRFTSVKNVAFDKVTVDYKVDGEDPQ